MLFLLNICFLCMHHLMGENGDDDYVVRLPEQDSSEDELVNTVGSRTHFIENMEITKKPSMYKYVVSVIVNDYNACVGAYVKPAVTLTTFCFFDAKVTKSNQIKIGTWESTKTNGRGEIKNVLDMIVHPNFDETTCNYDLVLLRMEGPFISQGVEIVQLKEKLALPEPSQTCLAVAPFDGVILVKKLTSNKLEMCKKHVDYKRFERCNERKSLLCLGLKEHVYGAPIICNNNFVGILPANIDTEQNFTVVQLLPSFYQWIQKADSGAENSCCFNKISYILYYYFILVIIIKFIVA